VTHCTHIEVVEKNADGNENQSPVRFPHAWWHHLHLFGLIPSFTIARSSSLLGFERVTVRKDMHRPFVDQPTKQKEPEDEKPDRPDFFF
jgi:hypothetical protein